VNVKDIIRENSLRNEKIKKPYNPVTGEGCYGDRVCLKIQDMPCPVLYLPKAMMDNEVCRLLDKHRSVKKIFQINREEYNEDTYSRFWVNFSELRIKYDFEYFACLYEIIEHGESHEDIPFRLNRAQREFLSILEDMRTNDIPIRAIVLKARQLGLSTEIQLYMYWIQAVHRQNRHSVICAHEMPASLTIRAMYDKVIRNMPQIRGEKYTLVPFQGSQNIKYVPERGCRITVGTAERPESIRSQNPAMAHMSEVALYPNTTKRGISRLIASIIGPVKRTPYTMIVYESTANGVGDYFHGEWKRSRGGKSAFVPVFLPWYYKEEYSAPLNGSYFDHSGKTVKGNMEDFVATLNEYEENLFFVHKDCTLENINRYRGKNSEMSSDEIMRQEFPSNDVEAFQDSGLPVFRSGHIEKQRKNCRLPIAVGYLRGDGSPEIATVDTKKRKTILSNIRFEEDKDALSGLGSPDPVIREKKEREKLKIWGFPDREMKISNRYVVVFDPQKGLSKQADWGIISVFDRYWMMYDGKPEIVAQWRGKIDKSITVWIAAQIAAYYNNALLVIESNTYDTDKDKDEDDSEFIFNTIADYYGNLYSRTPADRIKEGIPAVYGWHTNRKTKTAAIANYVDMLREEGYIEHEEGALDEALVYEKKANGKYGAKEGDHDDIIMTRMIGCYVCYHELPAPVIIKEGNSCKPKKPVNESSF
jgi:hypothetical protein